jgi:hypothetical protein
VSICLPTYLSIRLSVCPSLTAHLFIEKPFQISAAWTGDADEEKAKKRKDSEDEIHFETSYDIISEYADYSTIQVNSSLKGYLHWRYFKAEARAILHRDCYTLATQIGTILFVSHEPNLQRQVLSVII